MGSWVPSGPGEADAAAGPVQVPQQRLGGVAVLHRCGGDDDGEQQAGGVDGDVAFAAVDLLGVVPARVAFGAVSAARMDWESITAADGAAARPAAWRARSRSASCTAARVPSSRQRAKYSYPVRQGGKSRGRYRHAHPVRSTYKIAFGDLGGRDAAVQPGGQAGVPQVVDAAGQRRVVLLR
jgi:hypothetical protein